MPIGGFAKFGPRSKSSHSVNGPDTFVVIEKWANLTALRSHSASSHMEAFAERTQLMMAGRSVYILSPSEGRD